MFKNRALYVEMVEKNKPRPTIQPNATIYKPEDEAPTIEVVEQVVERQIKNAVIAVVTVMAASIALNTISQVIVQNTKPKR